MTHGSVASYLDVGAHVFGLMRRKRVVLWPLHQLWIKDIGFRVLELRV
jgi:hypothetical protein